MTPSTVLIIRSQTLPALIANDLEASSVRSSGLIPSSLSISGTKRGVLRSWRSI